MRSFAIVGCGRAGYECARTLRQRLPDCRIDVFDSDPCAPANPMLTTYYVGGEIEKDGLFPYEPVEGLCRREARVASVFEDRSLLLEDGTTLGGYDGVLISTGAEASVPAFLKITRKEIFLMRTPADGEALRRRLRTRDVKTSIVIGGSMVGIKVAEALHKSGARVTIADAADRLFPLAAYPETAGRIASALMNMGVELRLDAKVEEIDEKGCAFADGSRLDGDIVALCIGTRTRTQLVPPELKRIGILVDGRMETRWKGVFAAGDCCEGRELQTGSTIPIGLWQNAALQGRTAAVNMSGGEALFDGDILHNNTHFFGMDFTGLGDNRLRGERYTLETSGAFYEAVASEKRLLGLNILGNPESGGIFKSLMLKQCRCSAEGLTPAQRGLLLSMGLTNNFLDSIGG